MADNWQVGDLALCIRQEFDAAGLWVPAVGAVYTVEDCGLGTNPSGDVTFWLQLLEDRDPDPFSAFPAASFRRVTPGHEIEGFEERRRSESTPCNPAKPVVPQTEEAADAR